MVRKTVKTKISVVRTLNLPRDFQLLRGRKEVAKTSATSGFAIINRKHPGFRLGVRAVAHTMRAFVRYVLHRFKMWLAGVERLARAARLKRLSLFCATVLVPRVSDMLACWQLLLWLFHWLWGLWLQATRRHLSHSRSTLQTKRALMVLDTLQGLPCPPRCGCSRCSLAQSNRSVRREWEKAIIREAEASGKRPFQYE